MQERKNFNQLFRINFDGSFEPLTTILIGGVTITPGIRFNRGVLFAGVDFSYFIGKEFDVFVHPDGTNEIRGVYK